MDVGYKEAGDLGHGVAQRLVRGGVIRGTRRLQRDLGGRDLGRQGRGVLEGAALEEPEGPLAVPAAAALLPHEFVSLAAL
eukprot:6691939-Prymnesium_polylepis.1